MKIIFNTKMKIERRIISNGLNNDLNKCYPGYDPEQYSKGFSH